METQLDRPLYNALLAAVAITIAASSVAVRFAAPTEVRSAEPKAA